MSDQTLDKRRRAQWAREERLKSTRHACWERSTPPSAGTAALELVWQLLDPEILLLSIYPNENVCP